jgi:hypothetical protein
VLKDAGATEVRALTVARARLPRPRERNVDRSHGEHEEH